MTFIRSQLVLLFLFSWTAASLAGVVVEERNGGVTYYSSGKVKSASEDMVVIFDVRDGAITLLDGKQEAYATGTIEEYCREVTAARDEAIGQMSPEEKQMMAAFMGGDDRGSPPVVRIEKVGRGEKIAGYATTLFRVFADGEVYEEIHLADDVPVFDEVDSDKMGELIDRFGDCMINSIGLSDIVSVEDDTGYKKLLRRGYPMKNVEFDDGRPDVTDQVVRMEKRPIPEAEFRPPKGYVRLDFRRILEQSAVSAAGEGQGAVPTGAFLPDEAGLSEDRMPENSTRKGMEKEGGGFSASGYADEAARNVDAGIKEQIRKGIRGLFGGD